MKHIVKYPELIELINWKNEDKMFQRGMPKWNRIPQSLKSIIREQLRNEQGHICCYCERYMQSNDYHIEHIKPKGVLQYSSFLADYDNLLCSCQFEIEKGEPLHCGNSKSGFYDDELFVSPLDEKCERRFVYGFDGFIEPADNDDQGAKLTIQHLNLDIDKLNALRRAAIEPFIDETLTVDELNEFVKCYLKDKSLNNGRFNEFYTTIKLLFE